MSKDLWKAAGKRLAEARQKAGYLSQKSLATALGLSEPAIAKYEQGTREIPLSLLFWLHEKHSVNLNWLVTGQGKMFESNSVALDGNTAQLVNGFQKLPQDLQRDLLEILRMDLRREGLL
ncbi:MULTISPECIES: helix-turn-helix domain-containing protein [Rhizobium/Agrobacterium group]|uniref:helix-turn-helix domain-containing protein n=1 Tax=Rhizobium/Agrobacterium group TaxID=227290 RepID=UPI0015719B43|nr:MULTISPECIES: helix-turn-helix transcriptional regulator [Rhizobium/Agrobacterium group]MCF1446663.1 helix-turn-helix transcriptional regulator [Allorhizobium ampelinum]NSZ53511.1 helix-turn-helix transcriptional regulator [Agrobacterium vitis]NTA32270.1 helix-turn-helix transcriptional regulator [Agrobacterium vitis]